MREYPKKVMSILDLLLKEKEKGLILDDLKKTEEIISRIGYYRLRGYWFQLYDMATGKFKENTTFSKIVNIYNFDTQLREIIFDMTCRIEIALRTRFCEAILDISNDPIAYLDPAFFNDKTLFWSNTALLSKEINRSKDVFIIHNNKNHDGNIPIWAAVEVMSFGTLSKFISNLSKADCSVFSNIAKHYKYTTNNGHEISPRPEMLNSWIKTTVVLRNTCAHNARVYNRSSATKPTLLIQDKPAAQPQFYGLFHQLLAMKYLRPSEEEWANFVNKFENLLTIYDSDIDRKCLSLEPDWKYHLLETTTQQK